jgi:alanyl-tRNA synthetase
MISQEIRRNFLKYFKGKGHAVIPSSPVVPHDDPTLLFTNAGMNQFKDVFLGKSRREYTTATTSQKCIRVGGKHNDLDNVGHTTRHLTFFEMLGNFSFGDYFKKEAISYAWEVSTKIFQFDPEKIWVSIFRDDDEAFEIWRSIISEKRIVRLGEKDNFWMMGDVGPCGPCSELLYDRGSKYGDIPSPKEDISGERYLEFWNLVFMQFNRDAHGKMAPLPKQSIDTGSGLERVVALKMGVDTVFATDVLRSLIAEVEHLTKKKYVADNPELAPPFHVIADHIRSLAFAIADGAQPSNVERGYVVRKILRRAVRYGRLLGMQEPFLAKILPKLVETMGSDYPELKLAQNRIAEILTLEEEAFLRTLKRGGNILGSVIDEAKRRPQHEITGEEAFKLKDTYGLPIEEVLLIAKDSHLTVNLDAYQLLEEKARELSRASHTTHIQEAEESVYKEFLTKNAPSAFLGYTSFEAEGKIVGILVNGKFVTSLQQGEEGQIILHQTPFYAEKGGQVGDTGTLSHSRAHFTVTGCQNPYPGIIVHIGTCEKGTLSLGESVKASVEGKRRVLIQNNHTATHLLHWALQQILGPHIRQAGSLVDADRFRFDFNHHKAVSPEEIRQIEDLVNEKIRENKPVQTYELSYDEAQKKSEIKQFFGEKYGSKVRVIDIEFSKELCGGTHTSSTGTIGYFRIIKEGSIASGVRRIEAVTGHAAEEIVRLHEKEAQVKYSELAQEKKNLEQQLKAARRSTLRELSQTLSQKAVKIGSIPFLAAIVPVEADELAPLSEDLAARLPSSVLLLAVKSSDRCQLLLKVSADLVQKGVQANQLIKEIAPLVGGSGGGRPDTAQAGGKTPEGIEKAFQKVKEMLESVRQ